MLMYNAVKTTTKMHQAQKNGGQKIKTRKKNNVFTYQQYKCGQNFS